MELILDEIEKSWDLKDIESRSPHQLLELIRFYEAFRFHYYSSFCDDSLCFEQHLDAWLRNYSDHSIQPGSSLEEKKNNIKQDLIYLLSYITHISFITPTEIKAISLTAYKEHIQPWLINKHNLSLFSLDLKERLHAITKHTMFCSITDSMNISEFIHVNNLEGASFRPSLRSELASEDGIKSFTHKLKDIQQIIVLEDFVGTSTQSKSILENLHRIGIPILFTPLIMLESGMTALQSLTNEFFSISPVILVPTKHAIQEFYTDGEPSWHDTIRKASCKLLEQKANEISKKYRDTHILGYKKGGESIVLHTNCSNNSICLLHCDIGNHPIFPRVSRF